MPLIEAKNVLQSVADFAQFDKMSVLFFIFSCEATAIKLKDFFIFVSKNHRAIK